MRLGGARVVARGESLVARPKGESLGVSKWLDVCELSAPCRIFSPARCNRLLSTTIVPSNRYMCSGSLVKPCPRIESRVRSNACGHFLLEPKHSTWTMTVSFRHFLKQLHGESLSTWLSHRRHQESDWRHIALKTTTAILLKMLYYNSFT